MKEPVIIDFGLSIMIENLETDLRKSDEDLHKDCLNRIDGVISSTDRRFDYIRNDIDKLDKK